MNFLQTHASPYVEQTRQIVNEYFKNSDPFTIVLTTVATIFSIWFFRKITSIRNIKSKAGRFLFSLIRLIPGANAKIAGDTKKIVAKLEESLPRPTKERIHHIPKTGLSHEEIISQMEVIKNLEEEKWKKGRISGTVYVDSDKHDQLLTKAYSLFSLTNPLHPDVFPSVRKFEAEIIQMTINMLHGDSEACGSMTSGGTESILMALKAYRDKARIEKNITEPEFIAPVSAHAAFDKACHYFGIKLIQTPVDKDFVADVGAIKRAITKNTIGICGSCPNFPYGTIDPIEEMSNLARKYKIGFHTDCCLGGFVMPWAKKLGYDVPAFDFSLPGVTSISADTHKYGLAAKGTSVIMFRNKEIRRHMYYLATDWTGGLYVSPTMAGSRPGALIAACWASLMTVGEDGYMKMAKEVMEAAKKLAKGISEIPSMYIVGKTQSMVVAFDSKDFDVYKLLDALHGWSINTLQNPKCMHIAVTPRNIQSIDAFLVDLRKAVQTIKDHPEKFRDGLAPIYGSAATLPDRGIVADLAASYLDVVLTA